MVCAQCGKKICETYFTALDNFLQTKYFDSEEDNVFCSEECFCRSCMLEEVINRD